MEQRKKNISLWCSMGLLLILAVGLMILSTGMTMARYKMDQKEENEIEIRPLEHIQLGQIVQPDDPENPEAAPYFDPTGQGVWSSTGDSRVLTFAVANGVSEEKNGYARDDQRAVVRLVGSLGMWDGTGDLEIYLRVPATEPQPEAPQPNGETKPEEAVFQGYVATGKRIHPDTALYTTYGDGWIFTFLDEEGRELSWLLEGGELSYLEMILTLEGAAAEKVGLLRLEITGDYTKK